MMKFGCAVHITFIRTKDGMVPWHIATTSSKPPFETTLIGLDTEGLSFSYEDAEYNLKMVNDFPRSSLTKLDHVIKKENMKMELCNILSEYWDDGWDPTFAAMDQTTLNYLLKMCNIGTDIILLDTNTIGENVTLGAVCRNQKGYIIKTLS